MGLDIGDKRIGVALSDPTGTIASPHSIIERSLEQEGIQAILDLVEQQKETRNTRSWA